MEFGRGGSGDLTVAGVLPGTWSQHGLLALAYRMLMAMDGGRANENRTHHGRQQVRCCKLLRLPMFQVTGGEGETAALHSSDTELLLLRALACGTGIDFSEQTYKCD